MKIFIVLALAVASAYGQAGIVNTYNNIPLGYSAPYGCAGCAVAAPAVTYAAPAIAPVARAQFGYQTTVTHAAPVTYAAAPVAQVAYAAAPVAQVAYSAPIAAPVAQVAYSAPIAAPVAVPAATATQYHAQDVLGQASFGYSHPGQAHHAMRDAAGNVRGSYAYVNPEGNHIQVNYVADQGGFRAESNALPQAPIHAVATPVAPGPVAVAQAPVAVPVSTVPADTPEVVQARIAHAHAHQEARARNLLFRAKRQILAAPAVTYASGAFPAALTHSSVHHPFYSYGTTIQHPTAFSTYSSVSHPTAYTALAAPAAIVAPATYTQIHNNPGHAVSYRVY